LGIIMSDTVKIAAAYIRVSTEEQAELSPESQLKVVRDYAAKNGYIIPNEYVFTDEGISGRTAAKRPAFNKMVATAKEKPLPFEAVLLWKFSRFARNQEESVFYKAMLRKEGVEVVSVSEPLVDGPFGSLIERILEWMDEYYSIRLSGEVKRSMSVNAQKGRLQSTPSFGYRALDGMLVPVPEEAALVKEIFSRFVAGDALFAIAKWLNAMGVKTHRGSPFENRTLEYIIRNPVYIGKLRWTPTGKVRRDFRNPDTIVAEAEHEPLVDEETWNAAQKQMDETKLKWGYKARPTYELHDWCSGIVRCASCGATLIKQYQYFKCNNYIRGRCTTSQHISAELLHDGIITRLRQDCAASSPLSYNVVLSEDKGADELSRLKSEQAAIDKKLARLRELYLNGIDDMDTYKAGKLALEAESTQLEQKITALESAAPSEAMSSKLKSEISSVLDTLESPEATLEQKNSALRSIIEHCTYDKAQDLLTVTYRVIF
jgi:site-specific DNA recombinase